jgi:hypothetical protein
MLSNENLRVEKDEETLPEMRIWQAVITSTVEEWVHGPLRRKREAEEYLFSDNKDFRTVCESAGMDPDYLRSRLQQLGKKTAVLRKGN